VPTELSASDFCASLPAIASTALLKVNGVRVEYCHDEDNHRWRGACAPAAYGTFWQSRSEAGATACLVSVVFIKVSLDPEDKDNDTAQWRIAHTHSSATVPTPSTARA
jgi:hypothetical protein